MWWTADPTRCINPSMACESYTSQLSNKRWSISGIWTLQQATLEDRQLNGGLRESKHTRTTCQQEREREDCCSHYLDRVPGADIRMEWLNRITDLFFFKFRP